MTIQLPVTNSFSGSSWVAITQSEHELFRYFAVFRNSIQILWVVNNDLSRFCRRNGPEVSKTAEISDEPPAVVDMSDEPSDWTLTSDEPFSD
jgi:hypothetical protein